jgi:hypothetical protein
MDLNIWSLVFTAVATLAVNGSLIAWVSAEYSKKLQAQEALFKERLEMQRENFQHDIAQLRAEVDHFKESENRWIKKYGIMFNHFRTYPCPHAENGKCSAYAAYMERLEEEGGIL